MLVLAIDTSGPVCAVGIVRADAAGIAMLAESGERLGRGHAERLMPMLESMRLSAGIALRDLDRIAVTTGPGSFTGVRIGVAAARGLALALDIPALGIGTLAALAAPVLRNTQAGSIVTILDAKRGEVFARIVDAASRDELLDATALSVDALAHRLDATPRPWILAGGGAPLFAALCPDATIAHTNDVPAIADVARLGAEATPARAPTPLYARGADAKPQAGKALARA